MSAPRWLRGLWARIARPKGVVANGGKTVEPRELAPALIDEKWLAVHGLVDTVAGPYNAKGLHAVMEAVDLQPYGLWKVFVARLIATARRYSKDLHEQSIYVHDMHEKMEAEKNVAAATIRALKNAREGDAWEVHANQKKTVEQLNELSGALTAALERAERAEKAEAAMVEQVKAANQFRESMKEFTEKATA